MTRAPRLVVAWLAAALWLLVARPAEAHKPSDSYLTLTVRGPVVQGRWDLAIRDLDHVMGLDRDGSGTVTWGELRARRDEIASLALGHLTLRAEGASAVPCRATLRDLEVATHSDGAYAVLAFDTVCAAEPRVLDVDYELFFDVDPQHHGIVRVDDGALGVEVVDVLGPVLHSRVTGLGALVHEDLNDGRVHRVDRIRLRGAALDVVHV